MTARLPDFIVIGAAKSGTTTLFAWLRAHPDAALPAVKEPRFFSDEWHRGIDWYATHFAAAPQAKVTGEASTNYTDAAHAGKAAARMASVVPDARIVYLVRHPVERIESQYRYSKRKAATRQSLERAVRTEADRYVGRSMYFSRLLPYIEHFGRERILVTRFEDLVSPSAGAWARILDHLGLPFIEPPRTAHNVTAEKAQTAPIVGWVRDRGLLRGKRAVPRPVRRLAKAMLIRDGNEGDGDTAVDAAGVLDTVVLDSIWADAERLREWLGAPAPLWSRDDG